VFFNFEDACDSDFSLFPLSFSSAFSLKTEDGYIDIFLFYNFVVLDSATSVKSLSWGMGRTLEKVS